MNTHTFPILDKVTSGIHRLVAWMDKEADYLLRSNFNLSYTQFLVMCMVEDYEFASQRKIAECLNLTEAAISKQVDILYQGNFLIRKENPTNRREHILSLTETGLESLKKAKMYLDQKLQEMFVVLSDTEEQHLNNALEKLSQFALKNFHVLQSKKSL